MEMRTVMVTHAISMYVPKNTSSEDLIKRVQESVTPPDMDGEVEVALVGVEVAV